MSGPCGPSSRSSECEQRMKQLFLFTACISEHPELLSDVVEGLPRHPAIPCALLSVSDHSVEIFPRSTCSCVYEDTSFFF